jgi:hypothetical protein
MMVVSHHFETARGNCKMHSERVCEREKEILTVARLWREKEILTAARLWRKNERDRERKGKTK